jgi:hypothetical protein
VLDPGDGVDVFESLPQPDTPTSVAAIAVVAIAVRRILIGRAPLRGITETVSHRQPPAELVSRGATTRNAVHLANVIKSAKYSAYQ